MGRPPTPLLPAQTELQHPWMQSGLEAETCSPRANFNFTFSASILFSYKPRDLLLQSYDLSLFAVVSFESLIKFGVILRKQFLLVSYFITL